MIFPAVFAMGKDPASGPTLIFVVLPSIFAEMPLGGLIAVIFFILLSSAALTSTVSLLEVVVAYFVDERRWTRKKSVCVIGTVAFLFGLREVDAIVFATGFKATEYLFPMSITGRDGMTVEKLWAETGAQGYVGAMIPGCPNLWTLYGPNTNGGLLVPAFQEMETVYALKCIERLILDGKQSIDVKEEPYRRYNEMIDERNQCMAWSDPRAENYYWTKFGRSATQNPLTPLEMWNLLREPNFADLDVR